MAAVRARQNAAALADPSASLRRDRILRMRQGMGRSGRAALAATALSSALPANTLPTYSQSSPETVDAAASFSHARHMTRQYASHLPQAPSFAENLATLNSKGEEDALTAAYDFENEFEETFQDEDTLTQGLSSQAGAYLRAKKDEVQNRVIEQATKELEHVIQNAKTELIAKGASTIDEGELLEIPDTLGTGVSVFHLGVSFFQDSLSDWQKAVLTKAGFPPLQMKRAGDLFTILGTTIQVLKWSFMVGVVFPMVALTPLMIAGASCRFVPICSETAFQIFGFLSKYF